MDKPEEKSDALDRYLGPGGGKVQIPFNWGEFVKNASLVAGIIAVTLTLLGALLGYTLHVSEQIGDLKDRQGKLEGKMEMFLQDRQTTNSSISSQFSKN